MNLDFQRDEAVEITEGKLVFMLQVEVLCIDRQLCAHSIYKLLNQIELLFL